MSIALIDAVLHLPFPPVDKLIMAGLANNANEAGFCWPNQVTIAIYASVSERSVRDHLHALEADGWIKVLTLGNGRGLSTQYQLATERIKAEADAIKAERRKLVQIKAEANQEKAEVGADKGGSSYFRPTVNRTVILEPSIEPSGRARGKAPVMEPGETVVESLRAEFADLGDIGPEIDRALNHTASKKAIDMRRYLRNWLLKERAYRAERNANGNVTRAPGGRYSSTGGGGGGRLGVAVVEPLGAAGYRDGLAALAREDAELERQRLAAQAGVTG